MQAGECCLARQTVELALVGVDPAHEPVAGIARLRTVVAVKVTVQHQFIATLEPCAELTTKLRMGLQVVVFVEIRHHQPGDRHTAQCVDGFDKGLVIGPGRWRDIVQYQQQAGCLRGFKHWRLAAIGCRGRRDSDRADC
ncbi:hypothetical protein D9M71_519010 [compost metagenome]